MTFAGGSEDAEDKIRRKLSSLFEKMMNALYQQKGAQLDINILASTEAQSFINAHASVLDSAFTKTDMSESMRRRLQRSDYIFSGMKTFHELNEAFPSLLDANGNRKPFEQFLNDVKSIDKTYNTNYLRAEYNFAQSSAQMAAKWESFMEDGDRYNLQYRTAGDDKVRPQHAALNGVTLPPSDSFWDSYYPPNGWNCRCTVVQVRKTKYPATDHSEAVARGEEALQNDSKGIFRANSGKEGKTFPDYNPYTIRRCRDCDIAKGKQTLAKNFIPDNELCDACKSIRNANQRTNSNQDYYERLKNDPEYHSVEYDPKSGGVKAIHNEHIIHSSEKEPTFFDDEKLTSTDLEILCQDVLFKNGYRCILLNESKFDASGKQLPQLDTETNGIVMDIRAITGNGKSTIKNAINDKKKQLKNFNAKTGSDAHSLILYFHDRSFFDENQIRTQLGTTLHEIICVFKDGEIKKTKKD